MATVLHLRFPGRRYHATPWGQHVNEGAVEWPPSPWRLLRALMATGFAKHQWDPAGPPAVARSVLEALAEAPPSFGLPPATVAHSRHYVLADAKKPLILDAWARIDEGAVLEVVWPCDLDPEQRATLSRLATSLSYLGRAESWVLGELAERTSQVPNCVPRDASPGAGWEPVRVLCPEPATRYAEWRAHEVAARVRHLEGEKPTARVVKERQRLAAPFPADLIAALCADTGVLRDQGWSAPPGSQDVVYWRRANALEVTPRLATSSAPSTTAVPFALLALSTPSRRRSGLPGVGRVFPQGRLLHQALASAVDRQGVGELAMDLLGRDGAEVAQSGHRHAHLMHLPLDAEADGRVDHVLIWVPAGMGPGSLRAIRALRKTYMKGGAGELQVALVAEGDATALRGMDAAFDGRLTRVLGPPGGARVWTSATPFVAARYTKPRGKDSVVGQVQLELQRRGFASEVDVEVLPPESDIRREFRHHALRAGPRGEHGPPVPVAHALRLTFGTPVCGPICLGYGAHFGLGRFECAPASEPATG